MTVGCVAGDEECYEKFADLFDPIIEARHKGRWDAYCGEKEEGKGKRGRGRRGQRGERNEWEMGEEDDGRNIERTWEKG